ncbi:hypothetical protein I5677_05200 [Mobilitalea sibirica]|uniref:DUF4352 domain-containing protein n=1 Tax=Mobilitalea sibirica TaxID=1462919 RepID=A0A8J7KZI9_9FIRM|nr:hypothetical protein [Mobilitalea sibirica]MBH1940293.1 hypothetical protein [Mobilitalea sibirica]
MRKLGLLIMLITVLSLTGCIKKYQLSEQGSEVAAEYMAGLILKQDEDYKSSLPSYNELEKLKEEEVDTKEEENVSPTPTPVLEDSNVSDQNTNEKDSVADTYTLAEVTGLTDVDIKYIGYKLSEYYPEDLTNAYFSLTPREGNQLLVVSFLIENKSQDLKRIDLSKSKITYQLDINVGSIFKPLLTLLENDLQYLDISMKAGAKEEVLLIYEVSKDIDMTDINLIASKDNKTEIIKIK